MNFLDQEYYNNTILKYLITTGLFVVLIITIRFLRKIVMWRLKKWSEKTQTSLDNFIINAIERAVLPMLSFSIFYLSLNTLILSDKVQNLLQVTLTVVITFFILRLVIVAIKYGIESKLMKQENSDLKIKQLKGIMLIINLVIWLLGFIFLLDNFGFNITSIITGLGIGGIAVALAAQNILGDLFNYFVIFFDRPFEVGDFIVIDDKRGTVEAIGIKTSRIRSITGEELIFSNSDLTNSRIHNFKRMEKRRVLFTFGIKYQTNLDDLCAIPEIIKNIITLYDDTEFDRAHFSKYGDSSLDFEVVYYVIGTEYNKYMDIQQSINLKIFEEFSNRGIYFAYPTQTLFIEK